MAQVPDIQPIQPTEEELRRQALEREQIRGDERARALTEFGGHIPSQDFEPDQEARIQGDIRTFSDRLRDRRRTAEALSQEAGEHFTKAFDEEVPRKPSDIFRGFQTFQQAARQFVSPLEDQIFQREQLLANVQAQKRQDALQALALNLEGKEGGVGLGLGVDAVGLTPAAIRTALGSSMEDRLDKDKLTIFLDRLAELRNMQRLLASTNPSTNVLSNTLDTTTGLISGLFGQAIGSATQKEVRQAITQYRTHIRFKYFGSVLTKSEMKEADKFLVGTKLQEDTNVIRIDNDIKKLEGEFRIFLGSRAYTPEDVEIALASTQFGYDPNIAIKPGSVSGQPTMGAGDKVEGTRLDPYVQEAESYYKDY